MNASKIASRRAGNDTRLLTRPRPRFPRQISEGNMDHLQGWVSRSDGAGNDPTVTSVSAISTDASGLIRGLFGNPNVVTDGMNPVP
jgi:hypothetical protein